MQPSAAATVMAAAVVGMFVRAGAASALAAFTVVVTAATAARMHGLELFGRGVSDFSDLAVKSDCESCERMVEVHFDV